MVHLMSSAMSARDAIVPTHAAARRAGAGEATARTARRVVKRIWEGEEVMSLIVDRLSELSRRRKKTVREGRELRKKGPKEGGDWHGPAAN